MTDTHKPINYQKSDSFRTGYANNTYLENTAWDLKLLFGEVDQSKGDNVVVQHTAITIPWPQAKVLLYFLSMHVMFRELELGRITIPPDVINEPMPPEESLAKKFPNSMKLYEATKKLYDDFMARNPDIRPAKK